MRAQIQQGHLYRKGSSWHVRFREPQVQLDGTIRQVNRSQRIASVKDYPQKNEVKPLFVEFMSKLNRAGFNTDTSITLRGFVEERYLPWVRENLAASTRQNYQQVWRQRLSHRLGSMRVRDVRPVHVEDVLRSIVTDNPRLSKRTVQRAKALLSGVFARAVAQGIVDRNPVREIGLPKTKTREGETHAYTPEEIAHMIAVLPQPAKAVCAVAAYAGLTVSEIRGLKWSDYEPQSGTLHVRRGVWHSVVGETKTAARNKPVPVIPRLRKILDEYRGSLQLEMEWMFSSEIGTPLDLGNLVKRVIRPVLHSCAICGRALGQHDAVAHEFRLDVSRPIWHGYHGFRRGLATTLYSLNVPELVIQRMLRHKPGSPVTRAHYIRPINPELLNAMERLEESIVGSPLVPQTSGPSLLTN